MDEVYAKYPELLEKQFDFFEYTREEKFTEWWRRFHKIMQVKPEIFQSAAKQGSYKYLYAYSASPYPLHLHFSMFTECLKMLASKE